MKILVTGSTGFIGRHVVHELLKLGHEIIASARTINQAKMMPWFNNVSFVPCDLQQINLDTHELFGVPDVLVHLAWSGLPNYTSLFHFEHNLPANYSFLKDMIMLGTKHILVAGTSLEYGKQSGPLSEDMLTIPTTPYGLAKDTLRKFLQALQQVHSFLMQWVRIFYVYGPGQNPNSLLSQLDRCIDNADSSFRMTGGEQLRDYLHVEEIARRVGLLVENPECHGVINCCSGKPVSVRNLVEQHIRERKATTQLDLGYYPYPDYEPMAFWGISNKLNKINRVSG